MIYGLIVYLIAGLSWMIFSIRMQSLIYPNETKLKKITCAICDFLFWPISMLMARTMIKATLYEYKTGIYWEGHE